MLMNVKKRFFKAQNIQKYTPMLQKINIYLYYCLKEVIHQACGEKISLLAIEVWLSQSKIF